jgi:hypothetical protein
VALAALLAGAAEGDALEERAVIADDRRLADHDAHPVVDHHPPADAGAGVDLDPGQEPAEVREEPARQLVAAAPQPVGGVVDREGVETGRGEDDLGGRAGCRVPLADRPDLRGHDHRDGLSLSAGGAVRASGAGSAAAAILEAA